MLIAIAIILFALSYFAFQHAGTPRPKAEEQMKEDQGQKDIAAINKATCPDCGSGHMLQGPSGGMAVNVACESCLMEFNVGIGFGTGAFMVKRSGKMDVGRARVFGITAEEYQANQNALISVH